MSADTKKRVLLAAPRGYCAGVDRAVITVEKALDLYGAPVYVRKQIVHNKHVVQTLEARGAIFVDETDEVPEGKIVVFSAHGVSPAVHQSAATRNLKTIDANGIMHVSAKDKQTGKENKITIKSNSGLSEAEIEQMVKDAELNAESDKKARELIEARNGAEAQVHSVKKDLEEFKDDITEEQKTEIETAITAVEESVNGDDVAVIKEALEKVYPAMKVLIDKRAEKEAAATQAAQATESASKDDNVVDATFTETEKKAG